MKRHGGRAVHALAAIVLTLHLAQTAMAQEQRGFVEGVYRDETGEHKYYVFVPHNYTPDREWPVILFLHGAGERGSDGRKQVSVGLGPAIDSQASTFPFITVFPQCENLEIAAKNGWLPDNPDGRRALAILAAVEQRYRTDRNRVYLTGLSMGGFGAWAHAAANPSRWAAVVPICGGGDTQGAAALSRLPIWCFHGADDRVVPPEESRQMVEAVRQAGGDPRYTEFPGVAHNAWDPAYANSELYTWLLSQQRGRPPGQPVAIGDLGREPPRPAPQTAAFTPALEIPDAVYIRLGNEMLAALADSIPTLMPADALSGALPDVQQSRVTDGMTVNVRFGGVSYSGRVSRVLMEAQGDERLNVTVTMRDVRLVFNRVQVWGEFFNASCGPMQIVLGHRADLPLSFQVRPAVEQGKLRLKLLGTQFRLAPDNWTVGSPAWVNVSGFFGLFISEGRIVQGLRDGIYRDSSRIEREVEGSVPRMLARLENRFTLEPTEQLVAGLWPLPVYKPQLRTWPSFVRTDGSGITVGLGVSVAAVDAQSAPASPDRVLLPGSDSLRAVTGEKFQFGVAPGLMEPISKQVVADDAARAQVPDMPMKNLQPLADPKALAEMVPDLKELGDREVRAEVRLIEPLRLARGDGDAITFELPKVRCEISLRSAGTEKWMPYLVIDFSLRQTARPEVVESKTMPRALELNWQGDVAIDANARFAEGYEPKDEKIDNSRIRQILVDSWKEWTETGALAQVNLDDLDLGFSKLRARSADWSGSYLATTYGPAGIDLRNATGGEISYEVKGPYSLWGGPYALPAGQMHAYPLASPVTCRFNSGGGQKEYTLPPGSRFEFQLDASGQPDLYLSGPAPTEGAVSQSVPSERPSPPTPGTRQSQAASPALMDIVAHWTIHLPGFAIQ